MSNLAIQRGIYLDGGATPLKKKKQLRGIHYVYGASDPRENQNLLVRFLLVFVFSCSWFGC